MQQQPTLVAERLVLRSLVAEDVPVVQRLSRSRKVSHTIHWVLLPACHLVWNLASGRVLAKVGMKPEGVLRQFVRKGEGFEDVALVALLREEWGQLYRQDSELGQSRSSS